MSRARVERFPWGRLEGLTWAELTATRDLRAALRRFVAPEAVTAELGRRLGVRARALLKTTRLASPSTSLPAGAVGVTLAPAERASEPEARVLLIAEPALALTLAARALRCPPPTLPRVSGASSALNAAPEIVGALAAVARAVAARAHAGASPAVLAAGPAAPLFAELARSGTALVAHFTLLVDDEAFAALVVVDTRGLTGASLDPEPPAWGFSREALASLGATPLALRVVAASCLATVSELAHLRAGDVLLTGVPAGDLGGTGAPEFRGRVALAAPRGEVGIVADLQGSSRLVLSAERVALPLVANDAPGDFALRGGYPRMDSNDLPTDVLAEVPLVVRVELGAAELSASAWARTRAGDVLALGRAVGEPVVLRVSGTEVARGELVAIEGELGVRILSRSGEAVS